MEEGARFVFQAAPVAVLDNGEGAVSGLRLVRTELGKPDELGRRPFRPVPGSEFEIETDSIFLALGFELEPLPKSESFQKLAIGADGGVVVDAHLMTGIPGVFAGGDIVRGPVTALQAVRDGRKAAGEIDRYLAGIANGVSSR